MYRVERVRVELRVRLGAWNPSRTRPFLPIGWSFPRFRFRFRMWAWSPPLLTGFCSAVQNAGDRRRPRPEISMKSSQRRGKTDSQGWSTECIWGIGDHRISLDKLPQPCGKLTQATTLSTATTLTHSIKHHWDSEIRTTKYVVVLEQKKCRSVGWTARIHADSGRRQPNCKDW